MKAEKMIIRDYSLIGVETQKAVEMGLADAEWYQTPIPGEEMRKLPARKDPGKNRSPLINLK